VRNIDTVARVGGDEFVLVISPAAAVVDIEEMATRANRSAAHVDTICRRRSARLLEHRIATYPEDGPSAESLLAHADAAMYFAKQRGPNNLQRFAAGMDRVTLERVSLESDLYQALKRQQFELYYQPKVDTATGDVRNAEALIRWRHPERGLIEPCNSFPWRRSAA